MVIEQEMGEKFGGLQRGLMIVPVVESLLDSFSGSPDTGN
jgi:hypothetical protein